MPDEKQPAGQTKTLSLDEYRIWVHDQVAKGVMLKLGAILGVIGLGGFITVLTIFAVLGKKEIQGQVGQDVKQATESLKETVNDFKADVRRFMDATREGMRGQIAQTLLDQTKLTEELKGRASEVIKERSSQIAAVATDAVRAAVNKEVTKEKIQTEAKHAVDAAFRETGGPAALFEQKLRPIALDPNAPPGQREHALRQLPIFTTNAKRLRQDLLAILKGTSPNERELRKIAVQSYLACNPKVEDCSNAIEDTQAVSTVVGRLRAPFGFLWDFVSGDDDALILEASDDYIRFLAQFPALRATPLFKFALGERLTNSSAKILGGALSRMSNEEALNTLVAMAGRRDEALAERTAWQSLSRINPDFVWSNDGSRREAVRALLEVLPQHVSRAKEAMESHITRLVRAVEQNDRAALGRLRAEAVSLGHPTLDFVYRVLLDRPEGATGFGAESIRRDLPLIRRLIEGDTRDDPEHDISVAALAKLLRLDDWNPFVQGVIIRSFGRDSETRMSADVLTGAWIRRLEYEFANKRQNVENQVGELVKTTLNLPDCLYHPGSTLALNFAMGKSSQAIPVVLSRLSEIFVGDRHPVSGTIFRGQSVVWNAVEGYTTQPGVPDLVREMMTRLAKMPARAKSFAAVIGDLADRKRITKNWPQAIRWYTEASSLDPTNGRYYLGRSLTYLRRDQKSETLREALRDLDEALKFKALIDVGIALEFVRYGDEALAERAVSRSVEVAQDSRGKAGALENLGLYYIRTKDWSKAFSHTDKVLKMSDTTSWNWLIRAIAARHMDRPDDERRAVAGWEKTKRQGDVEVLSEHIKEEIDSFFANQ